MLNNTDEFVFWFFKPTLSNEKKNQRRRKMKTIEKKNYRNDCPPRTVRLRFNSFDGTGIEPDEYSIKSLDWLEIGVKIDCEEFIERTKKNKSDRTSTEQKRKPLEIFFFFSFLSNDEQRSLLNLSDTLWLLNEVQFVYFSPVEKKHLDR